jgi:hypothetical protein
MKSKRRKPKQRGGKIKAKIVDEKKISRYLGQGFLFWSKNNIYPPRSENDIFPLLATRSFSIPIMAFLP